MTSKDVLRFDVSGQLFCAKKSVIIAGPASRLTRMCLNNDTPSDRDIIYIDRPADMFAAILSFYVTGDLHMPMTSCPGAFIRELDYWDIKSDMLTTCCYYKMQCFLQEQETLRDFRKSGLINIDRKPSACLLATCSRLEKFRSRVWSVVDHRERTVVSMIYFTLALAMILLSIFTLAYSTDTRFQRDMTNCERLRFMKDTGMENFDLLITLFNRDCDSSEIPWDNNTLVPPPLQNTPSDMLSPEHVHEEFTYVYVYDTFDHHSNHTDKEIKSEPLPVVAANSDKKYVTRVKVPNMKVRVFTLVVLETITLVFFTIEFVTRLLTCPSIVRYFMCVINVADAAALISTYLHMLLLHLYRSDGDQEDWLDCLEYLQMLRSFRLFRIVKNVKASRVLVYSVKSNIKDLSILMLFLLVGTCTFASFLYVFEDKKTVKSIPVGWYWAIITMTTVGYGDVAPQTIFGRVVGCLCSISGVLLFALTVPIFANHFVNLYQYAGLENMHPDDDEPSTDTMKIRKGKSITFRKRRKWEESRRKDSMEDELNDNTKHESNI